ncbi:hypothetical protein BH11BAC2_BH11BAC2_26580 [soil metagenome]
MRFTYLLIFLFLVVGLLPSNVQGQNLVPNFSFETVVATPSVSDQLTLAQPWLKLNATPDLYYKGQTGTPPTPCDLIDVPYNVGGYTPERTGQNAYVGLQFDLNNNYREYISVPISIPLTSGELYRIDFWTQRADSSRYACNKIGALLSNGIPTQTGTGIIGVAPQIEFASVISDTANWIYVTGIYQATGGENYITIGLFRNDADPALLKTDFGAKNTGCSSFDNSAYYFVDDVGVRPVSELVEIQGDTVLCPNESTVLTANTNVPFWWSDSNNPNDTLSLATDITLTPSVPTTYYLHGIFEIDSVLITIVNPPALELGPDSLLCEGDTVELDVTIPDGILYTWSTGDTLPILAVTDTGTYWVVVDNLGCASVDTIHFPDYLPNPPFNLGEDSLYCFFIFDTLHLDAGDAVSYLWQPTMETTREITPLFPDTFYVTITRENGCPRTASLEVNEVCIPSAFIPSAFTPDGDGLNDILVPYVNNIVAYNFRILNRIGQTVFYSNVPGVGWDGKYMGKEAPPGVYVYRLNYQGLDDEGSKLKKKLFGTITLLR